MHRPSSNQLERIGDSFKVPYTIVGLASCWLNISGLVSSSSPSSSLSFADQRLPLLKSLFRQPLPCHPFSLDRRQDLLPRRDPPPDRSGLEDGRGCIHLRALVLAAQRVGCPLLDARDGAKVVRVS
jgi:hypothetical protein